MTFALRLPPVRRVFLKLATAAILLSVLLQGWAPPLHADEVPDTGPNPAVPDAMFEWSPVERPLVAEVTSAEDATQVQASSGLPAELMDLNNKVYLPVLSHDHNFFRADRIGFGNHALYRLSDYPAIRALNAGWYVDWSVRTNPERPAGIEFVQMVRMHQVIDSTKMYNATTRCGIAVTADRTICPYADPPAYVYHPAKEVIETAARRNPGSLWLLGNEMDRPDWRGGRMDEMTPWLYAVAYHDIRAIIKKADPTAKIAIGGLALFTPLRRQYLDRVWDEYQKWYKTDIPVDVWNIHAFIGSETCRTEEVNGREEYSCYSFAVPPGADTSVDKPSYLQNDNLHIDMATFKKQIRDFRAWMKSKGQMNKPLIVSEYGALYTTLCVDVKTGQPITDPIQKQKCIDAWNDRPGGFMDLEDPQVVHNFMLQTFDFFANEKDCSMSGVDECRLVQRWAWFSLQDVGWNFNPNGPLFDNITKQITPAGLKYSAFARDNYAKLQYD